MAEAGLWLLLVAFGVAVAVSLFARARSTRTAVDFQLAGQRVGVATNAFAICGDYVSAASFLGVGAAVYAVGLDGAWYATGFAAGFVPVLLFVAAPLRRFGERSIPDFLARRLQSEPVRIVSSVATQLVILAYLIPQLVGGGLAWELYTNYAAPGLSPYTTGIVASSAITAATVVIGGMRGTTWNQALQFAVLLSVLVWLSIAMLSAGFDYGDAVQTANSEPLAQVVETADGHEVVEATNLITGEPARFAEPGARYTLTGQFALLFTLVFGTMGLPHVMNRFFTSPTGRAARMTTVWVLGLIGLFYTLAVMAGTAARSIIADRATTSSWIDNLTVDGLLKTPEHALLALGRIYGAGWPARRDLGRRLVGRDRNRARSGKHLVVSAVSGRKPCHGGVRRRRVHPHARRAACDLVAAHDRHRDRHRNDGGHCGQHHLDHHRARSQRHARHSPNPDRACWSDRCDRDDGNVAGYPARCRHGSDLGDHARICA